MQKDEKSKQVSECDTVSASEVSLITSLSENYSTEQ